MKEIFTNLDAINVITKVEEKSINFNMNSVRKIIDNSSNPLTIELPKEYENKKLEVVISQLEEALENQNSLGQFFGK